MERGYSEEWATVGGASPRSSSLVVLPALPAPPPPHSLHPCCSLRPHTRAGTPGARAHECTPDETTPVTPTSPHRPPCEHDPLSQAPRPSTPQAHSSPAGGQVSVTWSPGGWEGSGLAPGPNHSREPRAAVAVYSPARPPARPMAAGTSSLARSWRAPK